AIINRRLRRLTALLNLDHSRALNWSFSQAVLSAIWQIEDGERPSLLLAQTLSTQKGTNRY
ncbi:MAG TPA: hypothetical protein VFP64_03260, partial [Pyrinomonadaceae bacterium]|nr:hypothetical protein [Pyrinomonadaceae bacterium]